MTPTNSICKAMLMSAPWKDFFSLNRTASRDLCPSFEPDISIPKVIHQTYHAPPWPDELKANMKRLEQLNPTWEYRFHDYEARRTFIEKTYGSATLSIYDSINPQYGAARADLFRYLLLYKCGGLYLDMKSTTSKPLDEVIRPDDVYLLSTWRNARGDNFKGWGLHAEVSHLPFGEFQQWYIAAAPGHPFLKAVIEYVLRNVATYVHGLHGSGAYAVLRVTGPVPYTLAIEPLRERYAHRMVDSREDLGLIYSIFDQDASRRHEKIFPHYSTLTDPLVQGDLHRVLLSAAFSSMKSGYKALRLLSGESPSGKNPKGVR